MDNSIVKNNYQDKNDKYEFGLKIQIDTKWSPLIFQNPITQYPFVRIYFK
jgi:hypothetical protein